MNPAAHHRYFPFLQPAGVARQAGLAEQAGTTMQAAQGMTLRQVTIVQVVAVAARENQAETEVKVFLAARAVMVL